MVYNSRERYSCICPICNNEFWACKSIFQEDFGIPDRGSGNCPKCKTYHNLTVDEQNKKMIVTPWEEYMNRKKGEENE